MKRKKLIIDEEEMELYPEGLKVGVDFEISNIKDISARLNSKTTTIDIPATAGNKQKLGFAEDWNAADPIDQKQKPITSIEVEGTKIIKGFSKIDSAETNDRISNYQLKVLGDNGDWRERLKDKNVNQLDYSSDDHTFDYGTVTNSWTVSALRNYVYDLIDRGKFTGKNSVLTGVITQAVNNQLGVSGTGVNIEDMYPAISLSSIFTKIFQGIGYTVSSAFLSGTLFTKIYFPFINNIFKHPDTWDDDKLFKAVQPNIFSPPQGTSVYYTKNANVTSYAAPFYFNNAATDDGFDTSGLVAFGNTPTYSGIPYPYKSFRAITTCKYKFRYKFSYAVGGQVLNPFSIFFTLKKMDTSGNVSFLHQTQSQFTGTSGGGSGSASEDTTTDFIEVNAGDRVWLEIEINGGTFQLWVSVTNHIQGVTDSYLELVEMQGPFPVHFGQPVVMNENLPDIGQLEFIQALRDEFNLYFVADPETRTIYIEPRDDFYSGTALDWSKKLDRNKPISIEYLGDSYTKRLRYKFKEDSNDKFVAEMNKLNDEAFASHEESIDNVFSKDARMDIENKLFAATWMDTPPAPLQGLKTVKIPRMWGDVVLPSKNTSFIPRMLYYAGVVNTSYADRWYLLMENKAYSMINPPPQSSSSSLITYYQSYPRFYFYGEATGEANLRYDNSDFEHGTFHKYYANTHKIINDSRLITTYIYLKEVDISNFDFRIPIYLEVEGNGAYFEVQSIKGYDPDSIESTEVKLIKQTGKVALVAVAPIANKRVTKSNSAIKVNSTFGGKVKNNPITTLRIGGEEAFRLDDKGDVRLKGGNVYTTINDVLHPVYYTDVDGGLRNIILSE